MSQTTGHAPKRTQNANDYATILVRVGENSWVIGDPNRNAEEEVMQSETDYAPPLEGQTGGRGGRLGRILNAVHSMQSGLRRSLERLADVETRPAPAPTQAARRTRAARRSNGMFPKKFLHVKRKVRESFQVGLIAGLILGCLSIVMFHQVEPSNLSSTPAAPAVTLDSSNRVMLPALHMEALQVGDANLSPAAAQNLSSQLHKAHIPCVLWRSRSGTSVIAAVALRASDLATVRHRVARTGASTHVVAIDRNAAPVTVGASLRTSETSALDRWLSAASSALNAMIAVSTDGGSGRDASAAYHAAAALRPKRDILNRSGYEAPLLQFDQDLASAYAAIQGHRNTDANVYSLQAAAILNGLQDATVGS